ncbi:hypothetical protein ACROYT_G005475 [Oculina patagonica]
MPILKGRARTIKVEPSIQNKTRSTSTEKDANQEESKSDEKGTMPPYLSTLKFQLKDFDADAIRQSDYLEEGIEYTSLPAHKTKGAQSITLPLNMPVVESEKLCFRRKGDSSPNFKRRVNSSIADDSKVSLSESHTEGQENTASGSVDGLNDMRPTSGKWFNDIDKLTSFKAKHRLEIFSKEKKETIREWTSSPKKFYKCILKCRQKQLPRNGYRTTNRERDSRQKQVSFPADVLLFSAIEENAASELIEIITTHKVDVNLCKNARGFPPLHRAVQRGAVDCVRALLTHAADVNLRDSRNRPAINFAISMRQFECIVLLIESGASVEEYTKQRLQEYEDVQVLSKSCYRSFEANV